MHSNTAFQVGGYVTAAIVDQTLVDLGAFAGSLVLPSSRAVGARKGSSGSVLADSEGLHTTDTTRTTASQCDHPRQKFEALSLTRVLGLGR